MVCQRVALWEILSLRGHLGVNQAVSAALRQIEKIIHFEARLVALLTYVLKRKD